jgi:hypothetical protein
MDNQLRPLNLGEILDRTADLYRSRFLLFTGTSAIFAAAMLAAQLLYLGAIRLMGYPDIAPHLRVAYVVAIGANLLSTSLLAGLSIAAFNRAVAWVYLGKPATVNGAVNSIFARVGRYVWLMCVTMFRAWGPLFGLYAVLFSILFKMMPGFNFVNPQAMNPPTGVVDPAAAVGALIGLLVVFLLFIPATIYGVIMSLRYSLAMPACVVEELAAGKAIRRSIDLSEGSRGRILVLGMLVGVVRLVLALLFELPMIVFMVKHLGQPVQIGWLVYQQFGVFAMNTLIGPIYSIGLTLFYYDQRIRKEGFDIEWMMQAANEPAGNAV